jgi:hypothetical protein
MIVRPRLNDFYNLSFTQAEVDFAIPFLDEDIPLYVDPFLLWKSPSQQDNSLHGALASSFNNLGHIFLTDEKRAIDILLEMSECNEAGLGNSPQKQGKRIGNEFATSILDVYKNVPQVEQKGLAHFEELQLLVENLSKDRISDISCNLLKSFIIDYTIQQAEKYNIPTESVSTRLFDLRHCRIDIETLTLPINPLTGQAILLIPKRWLRHIPWINFDDYYSGYLSTSQKILVGRKIPRVEVLEFNRNNYDQIQTYIKRKELAQNDCKNDPLFSQIPVLSAKAKMKAIAKLPTGKIENADKEYENILCPLLASLLYPELDFAQPQSRTDSGVLIRDLIFYNNTSDNTLKELYDDFGSKQIVIELKNVKQVETNHINQLNRYLNTEFGKFGIIFTRNKPPRNVFQNTIDLWSGQRKCILIMDDSDLELMCQVYENKQRKPLDVINKKFREFLRACPS